MKAKQLRQIPLVDHNGCVIGLYVWDELLVPHHHNNIVVLMAGGLGTRLGELTTNCPKPLLRVGNKPMLETVLINCKEYGFNKFDALANSICLAEGALSGIHDFNMLQDWIPAKCLPE